jgi:hypothetical protein
MYSKTLFKGGYFMKRTHLSMMSLLLAIVMIVGAFASCAQTPNGGAQTDAATNAATNATARTS